jgi:hypothetical protein
MQGIDITSREKLAAQDIEARMAELDKKIESDMALARQGDAAALERLKIDVASRNQVAQLQGSTQASIASMQEKGASERLQMQLAGQATLQGLADQAALERQREQIAGNMALSEAQRATELEKLDKQIASNKDLATLDAATKLNLGEMETATSRNNSAVGAMTTMQAAYMTAMSQSMANADIPASARAAYEQSIQRATEANIGLIEQMTGIDLAWGSNTIAAGAA